MYLDLHTVYCSILGRGSIVIYVRTGFFLIVEVSNLVKSLLAWPLKYLCATQEEKVDRSRCCGQLWVRHMFCGRDL